MLSKGRIAFLVQKFFREINRKGGNVNNLFKELAWPNDLDGDVVLNALDGDVSDEAQEKLSPFFKNREKDLVKRSEPLARQIEESPQGIIETKEVESLQKEKEETLLLTRDEFSWIVKQSRLNVTKIASVLGISRWMVYALKDGKRRFTLKMSKNIRDKLPEILPEISKIRERALKYSKLLDT